MKYLLSFVVDEGAMEAASPEEMREGMERWSAFDEEATQKGALIACEPLENSSAATTVHLREDGERIVSDGPFAESKEQLGGFACSSARTWTRRSTGQTRSRCARAQSRSGRSWISRSSATRAGP
jgi:hypothetical protein